MMNEENNANILITANTLLPVICGFGPVHLLGILNTFDAREEGSYRSLFHKAEYTLDRALNNLDSAKSKARESQALAEGSENLTSLSWKYVGDI